MSDDVQIGWHHRRHVNISSYPHPYPWPLTCCFLLFESVGDLQPLPVYYMILPNQSSTAPVQTNQLSLVHSATFLSWFTKFSNKHIRTRWDSNWWIFNRVNQLVGVVHDNSVSWPCWWCYLTVFVLFLGCNGPVTRAYCRHVRLYVV